MALDSLIKFVDIVSSILGSILDADHIQWLFSLSAKVFGSSSKLFTVDALWLFKWDVCFVRITLIGSTYLHPCQLMSLLIETHLAHDIVHIDICFRTFALWHSCQSSFNAALSGQKCFFLDQLRIVLFYVVNLRVPGSGH